MHFEQEPILDNITTTVGDTVELVTPNIYVTQRLRSASYHLHRHNFFEIEFFTAGSGINEINGIKSEFSKGSIYLYNQSDFHKLTITSDEPAKFYYVGFDWSMVSKGSIIYELLTQHTPIVLNTIDMPDEYKIVLDLFKSLLYEFRGNALCREPYIKSTLECLLIMLYRMQTTENVIFRTNNSIAKQALIYIQKNFRSEITLNSIANYLHTSANYLSSSFHKSFNKTVVAYINDMRLNYAANMLKTDTNISITDVCFECGYKTYSHFLRDFNKKFGISPKKYQTKSEL